MIKFMESAIGQIIARNGILAIILAFSMWMNHEMVTRLFTVIETQNKVSAQVLDVLNEIKKGLPAVVFNGR